jgi:glycosyltransferase involved in cell wall biosynthesis
MADNSSVTGKKIVIFSHSTEGTSGVDDELIEYLKQRRVSEIVMIRFPFTYSSNPAVKVYRWKGGRCVAYHESKVRFYKPESVSYVKDCLYGLIYGLRYARNADVVFAMNNLMALCGLLLRSIRVVDCVAYYMIDYTPVRYSNPLLNWIYYRIDRVACHHSDIVLPLHEKMIEGRVRDLKIDERKIHYHVAPFGNNAHMYSNDVYERYDKYKIVYFGGISKSKGAELFIPLIEELVGRGVKGVSFECIGGGRCAIYKEEGG